MSQLYSHQLYKPVFCTPAYMCVCTYSYICIHRYICTCINMFLHLNLHAIDHWQVVKHCIFLCGCVCGGKSLHLLTSLALWRLPCAPDLLCPVSQLSFQYVSVCVSCVWLFATPWTIACLAPLLMGFPTRILERVAISSSRGSSQPRDQTCTSCISFLGRQILYHWAT